MLRLEGHPDLPCTAEPEEARDNSASLFFDQWMLGWLVGKAGLDEAKTQGTSAILVLRSSEAPDRYVFDDATVHHPRFRRATEGFARVFVDAADADAKVVAAFAGVAGPPAIAVIDKAGKVVARFEKTVDFSAFEKATAGAK
jgi:hypothetical protein